MSIGPREAQSRQFVKSNPPRPAHHPLRYVTPALWQEVTRRAGDVATLYADSSKAARELGWRAALTLDDMCPSAWRWQSRNKYGFCPAGGGTERNGVTGGAV